MSTQSNKQCTGLARVAAAALLYCLCMQPAADQVSREAVQALEAYAVYKMARYPEAYRQFLQLARQDNVQGMLNVANMLQAGLGVDKDEPAALDWYRKAAERGSAIGMFYTGQAYRFGYGTPVDHGLARQWLERAAGAGSSEAQLELGKLMLQAGERDAALEWLGRAAATGDSVARLYLDGLSADDTADTTIDAGARALIENAWAAIDRALSNRNAPGVVHYLAYDAEIRVRLPGANNWTAMNRRDFLDFWQRSFDRASDYSMQRGALHYRVEKDALAVDSVIDERIRDAASVNRLRLQESALVRVDADRVVIERLSVVIQRL